MERKVIEIANDGSYLSIKRGFLKIENKTDNRVNTVALDEILSLIVSANSLSLSKNTITALTENKASIIFCGKNYLPTAITLPYAAHWQNGERIRKQMSASMPLQKSIWKLLIQRKISNQIMVLKFTDPENRHIERLKQLAKTVKSGDTSHNESIAAQIYFKAFFGRDFIRDRSANNINALLNYIYTVLRACTARAVAGAGLLPALGIIHSNKLNPFTLVDDLMEPYRPLADIIVFRLLSKMGRQEVYDLTPEIKRELTGIVATNLDSPQGQKPLTRSLHDTANSLAKSYLEQKNVVQIHGYPSYDELLKKIKGKL